jgi:hypothetical protein
MLFTALVAYAFDNGRRPSEVYEDYLDHREDYELLFAFGNFRYEEEQKALEQSKKGRHR